MTSQPICPCFLSLPFSFLLFKMRRCAPCGGNFKTKTHALLRIQKHCAKETKIKFLLIWRKKTGVSILQVQLRGNQNDHHYSSQSVNGKYESCSPAYPPRSRPWDNKMQWKKIVKLLLRLRYQANGIMRRPLVPCCGRVLRPALPCGEVSHPYKHHWGTDALWSHVSGLKLGS